MEFSGALWRDNQLPIDTAMKFPQYPPVICAPDHRSTDLPTDLFTLSDGYINLIGYFTTYPASNHLACVPVYRQATRDRRSAIGVGIPAPQTVESAERIKHPSILKFHARQARWADSKIDTLLSLSSTHGISDHARAYVDPITARV